MYSTVKTCKNLQDFCASIIVKWEETVFIWLYKQGLEYCSRSICWPTKPCVKNSLFICTPCLLHHSRPAHWDRTKTIVCQSLGSRPTQVQELLTLVPCLCGTTSRCLSIQPFQLLPSRNIWSYISLTWPFLHRHQHAWWPVDVMERFLPFCCWTLIRLSCHWAWLRQGHWHYRNLIDWLCGLTTWNVISLFVLLRYSSIRHIHFIKENVSGVNSYLPLILSCICFKKTLPHKMVLMIIVILLTLTMVMTASTPVFPAWQAKDGVRHACETLIIGFFQWKYSKNCTGTFSLQIRHQNLNSEPAMGIH